MKKVWVVFWIGKHSKQIMGFATEKEAIEWASTQQNENLKYEGAVTDWNYVDSIQQIDVKEDGTFSISI